MLTKKEKQVLELTKKGLKQAEIAKRLKISQPAVSSFQTNAKKKILESKKTLRFVRKLGLQFDDE